MRCRKRTRLFGQKQSEDIRQKILCLAVGSMKHLGVWRWFDFGGINMSDFMKQMQMVLYHSDDGDVTVNVYIKDEDWY